MEEEEEEEEPGTINNDQLNHNNDFHDRIRGRSKDG